MKPSKTFCSFVLTGVLLGALVAPAARASITTSGNYKTGSPTPMFSIGTPITLSITTSGSFSYLALDEWVTNDGSQSPASVSPFGQTLSYQINGGSVLTLIATVLFDNYAATTGLLTPNDGLLAFYGSIAVTAGQTLTILPGAVTFGSGGYAFNPPPAVFNGSVFLVDGNGTALSAAASADAVPEPATWAATSFGLAGLGVMILRRRVRAPRIESWTPLGLLFHHRLSATVRRLASSTKCT